MSNCLVIPCYNEERRLDIHEFSKFAASNVGYHILFVNDGSVDGTPFLLEKLTAQYENMSFLNLEKNGGKAEAVRQGFVYALTLSDFSYIGFWDADLATPLSELNQFSTRLGENEYDIVMGSRVLRLGGHIERKWYRHLLGRLFATVASVSLNLPVYDTQCGAKFFKASIVKDLFLSNFISYWIFDVELLFRYCQKNENASEKIYEIPLNHWVDVAGSKLSPLDFFKAPMELFKIYKKYKG